MNMALDVREKVVRKVLERHPGAVCPIDVYPTGNTVMAVYRNDGSQHTMSFDCNGNELPDKTHKVIVYCLVPSRAARPYEGIRDVEKLETAMLVTQEESDKLIEKAPHIYSREPHKKVSAGFL
ncbi:MAG: hypothetical protein V1900_00685 [Candidatus Aenigmatarchaeota archaeon]